MPKLIFTDAELKGYFKDGVRHHFYKKMVEHADAMKIHSDGEFPGKLITERRPNEPQEVQDYRKTIFIPKTQPVFGKVLLSLSKIRRSSDWAILHNEDKDKTTLIREGETLPEYTEENFPDFTSMTNWVFQVLLKKYAEDPNGVVFVFPLESIVDPENYLRPYPAVFDSCDTLDYVPEDYAVLRNPLGSKYLANGRTEKGESFFIVTTEKITKYDQVNSKGDLAIKLDWPHGLGELPVFRIGAQVGKAEGNVYLHYSRLAPMLPELDEAIREYSDLQAAKVLHIYPERYEYTNSECADCKGLGMRRVPTTNPIDGEPTEVCNVTCTTCQGYGYTVAGPYSKILLKPNGSLSADAGKYPPPPGYIDKDTDIVRIQEEGVAAHIYSALSSLNFQFLDQVPLNESGKAKEVDKDELNNTVHAIAEDIVRVMDHVYRLIALYRYKTLYSLQDIEDNIIPMINVPEKYDMLSSAHLLTELDSAKGLNPVIKNALEIEYAGKKFNTNPAVKERLTLVFELDPLPNITEDEKMTRLSNKGITLETYIISSNIQEFVQQAIEEDPTFIDKPISEQKKKMREYAKAQITAQDEAAAIVRNVVADTGLGPNGEPLEEQGNKTNGVEKAEVI